MKGKGIRMNKKWILVLGLLSLVSYGSFSYADTQDKPFDLHLKPSSNNADYKQTDARNKDTYSYVYANVNYVKNPKNRVTGYVMGQGWLTSENVSGGYYYNFSTKGVKLMVNYVKENKFGKARIKAGADPKKPNNVEGVWSPDYAKNAF